MERDEPTQPETGGKAQPPVFDEVGTPLAPGPPSQPPLMPQPSEGGAGVLLSSDLLGDGMYIGDVFLTRDPAPERSQPVKPAAVVVSTDEVHEGDGIPDLNDMVNSAYRRGLESLAVVAEGFGQTATYAAASAADVLGVVDVKARLMLPSKLWPWGRRRRIQIHLTGNVVWSRFAHDDSDVIGPLEFSWTSVGLGSDRWRQSVSLRSISPAAYDDVQRLVNSETVRRFAGEDYRPTELAAAIADEGVAEKDWFFICVNELPVGFGSLSYSMLEDESGLRRVATPCLFVVDERYRGQGFGRWALEGAAVVGLQSCDVVRVQVELGSPMAALCEAAGFELVGLYDAGLVMERRA